MWSEGSTRVDRELMIIAGPNCQGPFIKIKFAGAYRVGPNGAYPELNAVDDPEQSVAHAGKHKQVGQLLRDLDLAAHTVDKR